MMQVAKLKIIDKLPASKGISQYAPRREGCGAGHDIVGLPPDDGGYLRCGYLRAEMRLLTR